MFFVMNDSVWLMLISFEDYKLGLICYIWVVLIATWTSPWWLVETYGTCCVIYSQYTREQMSVACVLMCQSCCAGHRFSAFWLRSKCSICSYQLNIWYVPHWGTTILNWFLDMDRALGACSASVTGLPGIAVPPGSAHFMNKNENIRTISILSTCYWLVVWCC